MSHFNFTNKSFRGFTLIELLVVIAIIGLLGTIISGPINSARNKAKDAKKIADLKNLEAALNQYADNNGTFPATLSQLVPQFINGLPANVNAAYTPQADKYMYITYTDATGVRYGYHMAVHLSVTGNAALDSDADCSQNASASSTCMAVAPTTTTVTNYLNAGDPGAPTAASTDLPAAVGAYDSATSTCTSAVTTCVYDIRGSI